MLERGEGKRPRFFGLQGKTSKGSGVQVGTREGWVNSFVLENIRKLSGFCSIT